MKRLLFVLVLQGWVFFSWGQHVLRTPISAIQENSLEYEWSQKPVLNSKDLISTESLENWIHEGYGRIAVSGEKSLNGKASLLLESPTKGEQAMNDPKGRGVPWGISSAIIKVNDEDWSDWNRITFWVYPDLPGFQVVSLSMVFHNAGKKKVPDEYDRNGLNYMILENHKWNKVHWEIEHLGRDRVTGVELRYRLQGNDPEADDTVKYYLNEFLLEKVQPDHYEGWNVQPGQIAYNHLGYVSDMPKTALVSDLSAQHFELIHVLTNKAILRKPLAVMQNSTGTFGIMDFSEINQHGTYILKVGDLHTKPFEIGRFYEIYRSTIIKTLNHFYTQRCGYEIPGIHSVCHKDWLCIHQDKSIVINGGWHDAGDLSQVSENTAEAVYAMFNLAENFRFSDSELSALLMEEAKWGLEWVIKTRFGDGFRTIASTMDIRTDGILGTIDDAHSVARNSPHVNFLSAKTEAKAASVLRKDNPVLARYALKVAEEDWAFAVDGIQDNSVELAGAALNAAITLFEATGNEKYKQAALRFADYIIQCQQQEDLTQDIPLKGFFYRTPEKSTILHYSHRSHEQDPMLGLVKICRLFPEEDKRSTWGNAIRLYAAYFKQIAGYTQPYFMIPAGIYDLEKARNEIEQQQIKSGFQLDDRFYLKSFPTWTALRGNSGTTLSQAKGLLAVANYLQDNELLHIGYKQLDWHLGLNPFAQSLMYGEGYRFAAQYSALSGNLVGGLPVGVQTHFNRDVPYWPAENCYNWKEIWVHPSSRWLWIMAEWKP